MFGRKALLILAALAGIALLGGAWWGYDQLRGRFMDIEEAQAAFHAHNYRSAFRAAERLAPDGDRIAQTMLGLMYWKGLGTDEDYPTAAEWFSRAAEQGNRSAMVYLADMHSSSLDSQGGAWEQQRDLALAAFWYRRAAELGNTNAQRKYGDALLSGRGVEVDTEAGLAWIMRAIDSGSVLAMNTLGRAYRFGKLGDGNDELALHWYRRAAQHGIPWSVRSLVEMTGVSWSPVFDLEEAYFWALIGHHWWDDNETHREFFEFAATRIHRVTSPPAPPQFTPGTIDEEAYVEQLRAHQEAMRSLENWPYRLDEESRLRAEAAAAAVMARWPEPPRRGEKIELLLYQ